MWKDCGYFTLTKNESGITIKIKNQKYYLKLTDCKAVLGKKINYALIYEPEVQTIDPFETKTEVKQ